MEYRKLGHTDLNVSLICLGTMTWGQQNTEAEAHEQMDYAWEHGINFMDAAELYPVPPMAETQGRTEEYIGTWMKARNNRDKVILASKVTGPGQPLNWIRNGHLRLSKKNIFDAIELNLKRLQTDYIDLYQLHWPDRQTNCFGKLGFEAVPDDNFTPLEESLEALHELVQQGKIRHIGLSNETPWGFTRFLQLAKENGWPRVVSVQNPYSLLCRTYEMGMAEVSYRENVGLLAYSPLAFGWLTGKYCGGQKPADGRVTLYERFDRYSNPQAIEATEKYFKVAQKHGISLTDMALGFINRQPWVTSNIIGATKISQLKENINSVNAKLTDECSTDIEEVHRWHTYPSP